MQPIVVSVRWWIHRKPFCSPWRCLPMSAPPAIPIVLTPAMWLSQCCHHTRTLGKMSARKPSGGKPNSGICSRRCPKRGFRVVPWKQPPHHFSGTRVAVGRFGKGKLQRACIRDIGCVCATVLTYVRPFRSRTSTAALALVYILHEQQADQPCDSATAPGNASTCAPLLKRTTGGLALRAELQGMYKKSCTLRIVSTRHAAHCLLHTQVVAMFRSFCVRTDKAAVQQLVDEGVLEEASSSPVAHRLVRTPVSFR